MGNFCLGFLPLLIGIAVQIVASIAGMFLYFFIHASEISTSIKSNSSADVIEQLTTDFLNNSTVLLSFACAAVMLIICYFWYRYLSKGENKVSIKKALPFKRILSLVILALGFQILVNMVLSILMVLIPDMFKSYFELMELLDNSNMTFLSFCYAVIFGPISEEYFFRGVVQKHFKRALPVKFAIILQALLFGIYHMNLVQGLYAFFVGIILGYIMEITKSLSCSILFHIIFNFSSYLLVGIVTDRMAENPLFNILFILVGIGSLFGGFLLFKTTVQTKDLENGNSM